VLRPSYSELIDVLNNEKIADSEITSRYTIVLAVAKRARQIIEGASSIMNVPTDRAVSTAVRELSEGRLKVKLEKDDTDVYAERATQQYYKGFSAVSKDDLREDFKDKYEPDKALDDDDDDDYKDEDYAADEDEDEEEDEDYAVADEDDIDLGDEYDENAGDDFSEEFNEFDDEE